MQRRHFLLGLASLTLAGRASAGLRLPGKIYLVEFTGLIRSLASLDLSTMARHRLTKYERQEEVPCPSPDGKTLLFACFDKEGDWHVRKLDLASGQESLLVSATAWPVCWVSDQQFIANRDDEFWLYQADGQAVRKLVNSNGSLASGCMTPDGRFLFSDSGDPSQLGILALEGGKVHKLGAGSAPVCAGSSFLYFGWDGYFRQPLSGGKSVPVKQLKGCEHVCYSPNGMYLAWTQPARKGCTLVLATRDFQVLHRQPWSHEVNGLCWGG